MIPIGDDEFATLREGAAVNGGFTVLAVLVILWLALRSARIIFAVFVEPVRGAVRHARGRLSAGGLAEPDFDCLFRAVHWHRRRFRLAISRRLPRRNVSSGRDLNGRTRRGRGPWASGWHSPPPATAAGLSCPSPRPPIRAFRNSADRGPRHDRWRLSNEHHGCCRRFLQLLNPPAEPHPLGYAFLAPADRFLERNRIPVLVGTGWRWFWRVRRCSIG